MFAFLGPVQVVYMTGELRGGGRPWPDTGGQPRWGGAQHTGHRTFSDD